MPFTGIEADRINVLDGIAFQVLESLLVGILALQSRIINADNQSIPAFVRERDAIAFVLQSRFVEDALRAAEWLVPELTGRRQRGCGIAVGQRRQRKRRMLAHIVPVLPVPGISFVLAVIYPGF